MKWCEIAIEAASALEDLLTVIFLDAGAAGTSITNPLLVREYRKQGIWDCDALPHESEELITVRAHLPKDEQLPGKLKGLQQAVAELAATSPGVPLGPLCIREVEEEKWATAWKAYYKPVKVGRRIVVKPSWEDYVPREEEVVIELDPGMAFGTGTHATTAMCLMVLERYLRPGNTVFDLGTGTGILAIAAAKLGAAKVVAVDIDGVAVEAARENCLRNGVDDKVEVKQGNLLAQIDEQADIIVANIIADVILALIDQAANHLKPRGLLITSGIIFERADEVRDKMHDAGFKIVREWYQGEWVCIVERKE